MKKVFAGPLATFEYDGDIFVCNLATGMVDCNAKWFVRPTMLYNTPLPVSHYFARKIQAYKGGKNVVD